MVNKKLGSIILRGGTSEEIRKEFPKFPINPTQQYFCELGYKISTAKRYLRILRKSNEKENKDKETNKQKICKSSKETSQNEPKTLIINSENADFTNLLIDTCVLEYEETIQLIEKAKKVTFIYSTIEEMDKVNGKSPNIKLKKSIRQYYHKILEDTDNKYRVSTFSGSNDESYPDNTLIQYLLILPLQERPTLLTADKNLAVKAKAWNLQYILFDCTKMQKEEICEESKQPIKKLGFGVYRISYEDGSLFVENRGTFKVDIIHINGSKTHCERKMVKIEKGDEIYVYVKKHGKICERHIKNI